MMAATSSTSSAPQPPPPTSRPLNLSNPVPLSAAQESQVRNLYYKNVRAYCADEIREFAQCAKSRTFTATWVCRTQRLAMNGCMIAHAKPEEEDRAREEWLAGREERREKRLREEAEVEGRRKEVIDMIERDRRREEGELGPKGKGTREGG